MRSDIWTVPRAVFFLLALLWAAPGVLAEVSHETLERLADLRVETYRIEHLAQIGKVTPEERIARLTALRAEEAALWKPLPQNTHADAESTIEGLSRTKLSLLEPQWDKELRDFRKAVEEKNRQTARDLETDAHRAVAFQRERLLLQRQLEKGTIDRDAYAVKDRAAVAAIADLRKKYDTPGRGWAQQFDGRLETLTRSMTEQVETTPPKPHVTAGQGSAVRPPVPSTPPAPPHPATQSLPAGDWLGHAPAVAQVFKDIQGKDPIDTAARQAAAFEIMRNAIQTWTGELDTRRMSPRAAEKFLEYSRAFGEKPYGLTFNDGACTGDACIRRQFFEKQYRYSTDPLFTAATLGRYFPAKYVADYTAWQLGLPSPTKTAAEAKAFLTSTTLWLSLLAVGGILLLWWIGKKTPAQPADQAPPLSDTYGTAQWAAHQITPSGPTAVARGLMFGKSSCPDLPADAPGAPITSMPEAHTLVVSRTGGGKGTRILIPTLLRYDRSMLVIDPKGENAAVTGRTRRDQLRQEVHILNPWGVLATHYSKLGFQTATYNPLDALDRDDPNITSTARILASIICPVTDTKQPFWQGSAARILAGIMLWLTDRPDQQKTLARVREIVTLQKPEFIKIIAQMLATNSFQGAIKEAVGQAGDISAADTYGGIMYQLQTSTEFLDAPVKTSTAASSFSMEKLADGSMTVYVVIPFKLMKTHAAWLRLVLSSAMHTLISSRDKAPEKPLRRCMFLIDEFGSIGHIPDISSDLAQMRGYGMDFTLILQGLNQLTEHYKNAKDSILGNCVYKYFCDVNDLETAKYLSESLGKSTVRTIGKSTSTGQSAGGATEGESTTYGETGRPLLNPDEILTLGREKAILLNPSTSPHYLRPVDYWKLPETFAYLKDSYPQFYWMPVPLAYDPNPYWQQPHAPATPKMTDSQARKILGVKPNATPDEIRSAYKTLMKKVHPDVGGSDYFAGQLNAAKAFLLGE